MRVSAFRHDTRHVLTHHSVHVPSLSRYRPFSQLIVGKVVGTVVGLEVGMRFAISSHDVPMWFCSGRSEKEVSDGGEAEGCPESQTHRLHVEARGHRIR